MSQPSKINNYQVNQSQEEEFDIDIDVEHVVANPPAAESAIVNNNVDNDDDAVVAVDGGFCGGSSTMSKCASLLVNKKAAASAVVFVAAVGCTGALVGKRKQQQQALLAAINSSSGVSNFKSKTGKSSFCEPVPIIQCGDEITDQKVVLSDDLFCANVDDKNFPVAGKVLNAVIKLSGRDARIDCKGHTIRQVAEDFGKSAVECTNSPGSPFSDNNQRATMKTNCNIYYQVGILLEDGATAINCKVEHFYDGFMVLNGGKVKNSEASRNNRGVFIQYNDNNSIDTKISDV